MSAAGFDTDCGGSVVKGRQGRLVIGWHQCVALEMCVHLRICVWSQTISEYCKAKYIAPANLHRSPRMLIRCHPLTLHWMLISSAADTVYYFLWVPTPIHQFTILPIPGAIQPKSHPRLSSMTAPLSLCLVFNCLMPQGLLGAGWAGLNIFSGRGRGGLGDRTLAVSGAGVERRDGEAADKPTMGSHSPRQERREILCKRGQRKHPLRSSSTFTAFTDYPDVFSFC